MKLSFFDNPLPSALCAMLFNLPALSFQASIHPGGQ